MAGIKAMESVLSPNLLPAMASMLYHMSQHSEIYIVLSSVYASNAMYLHFLEHYSVSWFEDVTALVHRLQKKEIQTKPFGMNEVTKLVKQTQCLVFSLRGLYATCPMIVPFMKVSFVLQGLALLIDIVLPQLLHLATHNSKIGYRRASIQRLLSSIFNDALETSCGVSCFSFSQLKTELVEFVDSRVSRMLRLTCNSSCAHFLRQHPEMKFGTWLRQLRHIQPVSNAALDNAIAIEHVMIDGVPHYSPHVFASLITALSHHTKTFKSDRQDVFAATVLGALLPSEKIVQQPITEFSDRVEQILEIFPKWPGDFARYALEHYKGNVELLVEDALQENLPTSLSESLEISKLALEVRKGIDTDIHNRPNHPPDFCGIIGSKISVQLPHVESSSTYDLFKGPNCHESGDSDFLAVNVSAKFMTPSTEETCDDEPEDSDESAYSFRVAEIASLETDSSDNDQNSIF